MLTAFFPNAFSRRVANSDAGLPTQQPLRDLLNQNNDTGPQADNADADSSAHESRQQLTKTQKKKKAKKGQKQKQMPTEKLPEPWKVDMQEQDEDVITAVRRHNNGRAPELQSATIEAADDQPAERVSHDKIPAESESRTDQPVRVEQQPYRVTEYLRHLLRRPQRQPSLQELPVELKHTYFRLCEREIDGSDELAQLKTQYTWLVEFEASRPNLSSLKNEFTNDSSGFMDIIERYLDIVKWDAFVGHTCGSSRNDRAIMVDFLHLCFGTDSSASTSPSGSIKDNTATLANLHSHLGSNEAFSGLLNNLGNQLRNLEQREVKKFVCTD